MKVALVFCGTKTATGHNICRTGPVIETRNYKQSIDLTPAIRAGIYRAVAVWKIKLRELEDEDV